MIILVVDDELEIAEELADYLSAGDRVVHFTANAAEALDMARTIQPDLLITDMRMPGMDGAELVRRVFAHDGCKKTRFIIVSGHLGASEALAHLHDIPYTLIPKPLNMDQLHAEVAGSN